MYFWKIVTSLLGHCKASRCRIIIALIQLLYLEHLCFFLQKNLLKYYTCNHACRHEYVLLQLLHISYVLCKGIWNCNGIFTNSVTNSFQMFILKKPKLATLIFFIIASNTELRWYPCKRGFYPKSGRTESIPFINFCHVS